MAAKQSIRLRGGAVGTACGCTSAVSVRRQNRLWPAPGTFAEMKSIEVRAFAWAAALMLAAANYIAVLDMAIANVAVPTRRPP